MDREAAGFTLSLADGSTWTISAKHHRAEDFVSRFCKAMHLRPGSGCGRVVSVSIGENAYDELSIEGVWADGLSSPLRYNLGKEPTPQSFTNKARCLSLLFALAAQHRGGGLVHGALAEYCPKGRITSKRGRYGVILAGPGGIGKTTASGRLGSPWASLSDDMTMIVRDSEGSYWAHPWPTWSRFFPGLEEPGPGGSWDVQYFTPLKAIFFLSQSSSDSIEALSSTQTMGLLVDSVRQALNTVILHQPERIIRAIHFEQLAALRGMMDDVPGYRLAASLSGTFWKMIEKVVEKHENEITRLPADLSGEDGSLYSGDSMVMRANQAGKNKEARAAEKQIVYFGCSMNPTLREPELLDVKAYDGQSVRIGDVVYFQRPEKRRRVVHRVVKMSSKGIQTRGDNNGHGDSFLIQPSEILGQVVAARRFGRIRHVRGGIRGRLAGCLAHILYRRILQLSFRLVREMGVGLCRLCAQAPIPLLAILPTPRLRVVLFKTRAEDHLKLMIGSYAAGYYPGRKREWYIRLPFRLFVDEANLPRPKRELSGNRP